MPKLVLDKNNMVDSPTLLLQNKNFDVIGNISNYYKFNYTENFNSANEVFFMLYKQINSVDDSLWNSIINFKVLYIPEYKERFEIKVSENYENSDVKNITATSLCEAELSQITIRNIEINTESDIANTDYDANYPTVFCRDVDNYMSYPWSDEYINYPAKRKQDILRKSSLLHRLLEKAPHYSIGHVDETLMNLQRTFSISETDIYSELTGEIANEFHCLFVFDSLNRTISAYDLYNTCEHCAYRGDFTDTCPRCESKDIGGQYGEDTTVFITRENLAKQVSIESNGDSLKNCFYVEGGDDLINSAIRMINPNGSQYIYNWSDDTKSDMPEELREKLQEYDNIYQSYLNDKTITITNDSSIIAHYNTVVSYLNSLFNEKSYKYITQNLYGYSSISMYIWEATDIYQFIKTTMMPTIEIDHMDIDSSLANIINGFKNGFKVDLSSGTTYKFQNEIAISNPTSAIQTIVERRILNTAKLYYNTALYDLELKCSSYIKATSNTNGSFTGKFILTSIADTDDNGDPLKVESGQITLKISDDVLLFTEQEIITATADKDNIKDNQITSLSMDLNTFKERIKLYSIDELTNLLSMFESCLSIIEDKELASNKLYKSSGLYDKYRSFYLERITLVNEMLSKLDIYLSYIEDVYFYDSSSATASGILSDARNSITNILDIKNFLGNYYNTFCSYIREDTYSNSNYISDGLNNSEVLERAEKLLDVANKELYKASNLQYTVSADINNLLVLPEFKPFADKFEVGNWIRIGIDDKIYKLRLLSYKIQLDELQTITLEFSTVEKIYNGTSDFNSIVNSVSSLATSYSSITNQVEKGTKTTKILNDWVRDGLTATQTKFSNASNQCLIIDENGLLARSHDSIYNTYSPYQLKIINNGLYTTHNAWETIDTGIGRISYYDPILEKNVDDYGIIARTLVGHLILGENLVIANCNKDNKSTVIIDANGITLDSGYIRWTSKLGLDDLDEEFQEQISKAETDILKNAQNLKDFINGDFKNATYKIEKNTEDIVAEEKARIESYNKMDSSVAKYLGLSGETLVGSNYVISPYIGGGYLSIINEENGSKVVIDPAAKNTDKTNGDLISATYNNEKVFCVDVNGKAYFSGEIKATSGAIGGWYVGETRLKNSLLSNYNYIQMDVNEGIDILNGSKSKLSISPKGYIRQYGTTTMLEVTNGGIGFYKCLLETEAEYNDTTGETTELVTCTDYNLSKQYMSIYPGEFNSDDSTMGMFFKTNTESKYVSFVYEPTYGNPSNKIIMNFGGITGINYMFNVFGTSYFDDYVNIQDAKLSYSNAALCCNKTINAPYFLATNSYSIAGFQENGETYPNHLATLLASGKNIARIGVVGTQWIGSGIKWDIYGNLTIDGYTTSSDERLKNSFEKLDKFDEVFMLLEPTTFKYNYDTIDKIHFGFKAQNVKKSLNDNGFKDEDYFIISKTKKIKGSEEYHDIDEELSLSYQEFTAWNTHMIQKCIKENQELKSLVTKLQNQINNLEK